MTAAITKADRQAAVELYFGLNWEHDINLSWEHDINRRSFVDGNPSELLAEDPVGHDRLVRSAQAFATHREQAVAAAVKAERERIHTGLTIARDAKIITRQAVYDVMQIVNEVRPVLP